MRRYFTDRSGRVALSGLLAAGSLVVMLLAGILPAWRMGLTAVSGLFPMVGVLAAGRSAGLCCWAAAGILGFLLIPDKGAALLYLLFFGLYPVLKERIEGLRRLAFEYVLKAVYFNGVLTVLWFCFRSVFLPHPPLWLIEHGVFLYILGNFAFICYDYVLSRMVCFLRERLRLR